VAAAKPGRPEGFEHVWHLADAEGDAFERNRAAGWAPEVITAGAFMQGFELAARFLELHPERAHELVRWLRAQAGRYGIAQDAARAFLVDAAARADIEIIARTPEPAPARPLS
jgi:hypothetical protein